MTYRFRSLCFAASLTALLTLSRVHAAPVLFTVDDSQSKITLSGAVLGNQVKEQGPGSLLTTFGGTIVADVGAATIQFPGGSVLDAKTNGVWKPGPGGAAAAAPADFAAQATTVLGSVRGALRNLVLDVTSGPIPVTAGQFNASELRFAFPQNSTASFDYDAGFLGAKGIALGGISTNKLGSTATLTTTADGQTLTINVDTEFKFTAVLPDDSSVHLTGKLVATSMVLPSITSVQFKDQHVILHVTGAGPTPRLDSSSDLNSWTIRTPERSGTEADVVLTLPAAGPQEFYRVVK